jgi:hypothetical protein
VSSGPPKRGHVTSPLDRNGTIPFVQGVYTLSNAWVRPERGGTEMTRRPLPGLAGHPARCGWFDTIQSP